MLNINFVPDDYVQKRQSLRANRLYLILFLALMVFLGGMFLVIKLRQRAITSEAKLVNGKMAEATEAIRQLEQLQSKRKLMMKAALTTAELVEPVPRSVVLASLTNNLPAGVSLVRLKLTQKEPKSGVSSAGYSSKYEARSAQASDEMQRLRERTLETHIELEGIAPSNIQVAGYIERLGDCVLFEDVALVHSKEREVGDDTFLEFKLTAALKRDVQLSREDIASIRSGRSSL